LGVSIAQHRFVVGKRFEAKLLKALFILAQENIAISLWIVI